MNARSATLTITALFALSVPAANAAVVFGDGGGPATGPARTPAVATQLKHHATTPAPPAENKFQVQRNLI